MGAIWSPEESWNDKHNTYLEILNNLAHDFPKKPGVDHIFNDSWWQANENDHKICHRQIYNKVISDSSHAGIAPYRKAHQEIAYQSYQEHDKIENYEGPSQGFWENVVKNLLQAHISVKTWAIFTSGHI